MIFYKYTHPCNHPPDEDTSISSTQSQKYLGLEESLPGFLLSPPEGGWISLSINIIPSSGLCVIFYTGWRITVNVLQLFGNEERLNYISLTWQALRMCGFWKVETIGTNTFVEIAINPKCLNFPLPCLHHSGLPLPNFPFIKGVTHPYQESYRICGKEYGIWSLPGLVLQFNCTIS